MAVDGSDAPTNAIRARFTEVFRSLRESDDFRRVLATAASSVNEGTSELEALLGEVVTMADYDVPATSDSDSNFEEMTPPQRHSSLKHLPERTVDQHSFLIGSESHLFLQLKTAFEECCAHSASFTMFENLPLWASAEDKTLLFTSFLIKVACGSGPARARESAPRLVACHLATRHDFDCQALVPYLVFCFTVPTQNVRQAAAEALLTVVDSLPKSPSMEGGNARGEALNLYDSYHTLPKGKPLAPSEVAKILQKTLMLSPATTVTVQARSLRRKNSKRANALAFSNY